MANAPAHTHVVRRIVDPVVEGFDDGRVGVDEAIEPVVGGVSVDVPHELELALDLDEGQTRLDLGGGKVALSEDDLLAVG